MSSSPIMRSDDLRTENRYRLLRALRGDGALTRAVLGERTSLSQAALSTLIAQLGGEGVLESDDGRRDADADRRGAGSRDATAPAARRGRPQTRVSLAGGAFHVLTVSLQIDRLRMALVDYAGAEIEVRERRLDTRGLDERTLIRTIGDSVVRLARRAPDGRVEHIGVSFQGRTCNASGDLRWSPILGTQDVPLGRRLAERLGVPTNVSNDCMLIARALRQQHADTLGENFATVLFSHGVGLGLTLDGRPFTGIRSSALEFGHLTFERGGALCRCGRRGCIEAYSSDYGIARLSGDGPMDSEPPGRLAPGTLRALVDAARAGCRAETQAFAIAGAAVGEGLADLFTLLDTMPVALVGRGEDALGLMIDAVHGAIEAAGHTSNPPIVGFADDDPLLHAGLALDTLDAFDRRVASRARSAVLDAPGVAGKTRIDRA